MAILKLFLLGPPRIEHNDTPVNIERRKALAILIYLAVSGRPHSRDALATLFWPDQSQSQARAYLRRDLAVLNTSLVRNWLLADRETVELQQENDFWLDIGEFHRLLAETQQHHPTSKNLCADCLSRLAQAANLYTDDFLAGFSLRDSAEFDDWQFFQAESLRQELAQALERLVEGYSAAGAPAPAIPYARRWLALDPLHEPAQRQLIALYDQAGQPAAALRQYEEYVKLLEAELGLPPEEETTTLYEAIKAKRMLAPYFKAEQQPRRGPESEPEPRITARDGVEPLAGPPPKGSTPYAPDATIGSITEAKQPSAGKTTEVMSVSSEPAAFEARHNLPAQPTPFIGREVETAEIVQLLLNEPACRLLTLVGPGGIGKTRLALAAAAQATEAFRQGVYFVPLAPVAEPSFIVPAMAEALHLNFHGAAEPKQQLVNFLREKKLLLVIDNFEHLSDGAELLSELLSNAPQLKLLVTSRERLRLQEEWSYEVQGLPFPLGSVDLTGLDLQELEEYSAVRLFLQRARRAEANFILTHQDVLHIVRICRSVDGMPLGLELAAPWVRLMSCREIADEVERNLDLLSTSLRNVPERHRSLRAIFEQTWARLSKAEQTALGRLAIFRGGCLRDAAEAVTGANLPILSALVDQALLRRSQSGRYEMHELVRQFALEQLQADPPQYEQILAQHVEYYTTFLYQRTDDLKGSRQQTALEEITAELDNIRAAWQQAVLEQNAPALEKATECLWLYSEMQGAFSEGETIFQRAVTALAQSHAESPERSEEVEVLIGFLRAGQGLLMAHLDKLEEGLALMEQGVSQLQTARRPDKLAEAFALMWLGWTYFLLSRNSEAEETIRKSLALFTSLANRWGMAKCLFVLGNIFTARGELAQSGLSLQKSLKICREIKDNRSCLLVNRNLGILALWFGDYDQAQQLLDEAVMISQEFDDQQGLVYALRELGKLARAKGQYDEAIRILQNSINIAHEIGNHWEAEVTLDDLGAVYRACGDHTRAEQLFQQCLVAAKTINNRYWLPRCLSDLGLVSYETKAYRQAEQRQLEALAIWRSVGHEPYQAYGLSRLGCVMLAMGEPRLEEARHYFAESLQLSVKHRLAPIALEVFVAAARHLAQLGQLEQAVELLALAEYHPASTHETKQKARQSLSDLTADLPSAAIPAGPPDQRLDWQAAAERLIGLLSKSGRAGQSMAEGRLPFQTD